MDEFDLYCQIAGSTNNSAAKLKPSTQRGRSRSLHPGELLNEEHIVKSHPKNYSPIQNPRRDSLQNSEYNPSEQKTRYDVPQPIFVNPPLQNIDTQPTSQVYRVRSFKRTSKGVISKGDSLRTKSTSSQDEHHEEDCEINKRPERLYPNYPQKFSMRNDVRCPSHSSVPSCRKLNSFLIQLVGAPLVGKSSLTEQFLDPDFLDGSYIPNLDQNTRTLTVELDGKEYNLTFLDNAKDDDEDPNMIQFISSADGYMIVYGIDDYNSFEFAKTILHYIWNEILPSSALFLVANKSDLERGREVTSEEGKHLAKQYDCQFLEISTALNHKINDLIVKFIQRICHQKEKFQNPKRENQFYERKSTKASSSSHHHSASSHHHIHTNSITNFFRKHFSRNSPNSSFEQNN